MRGRPATRRLYAQEKANITEDQWRDPAERYRLLKAKGLCTHCVFRPCVPGLSRCEACRDYGQTSTERKAQKHRAQGRCRQCGQVSDTPAWRCTRCKVLRSSRRKVDRVILKKVVVPYSCTNNEDCPARTMHDCEDLENLHVAIDELFNEPLARNTIGHMVAVTLTAMIYFSPRRDDAAMALAAFTGYSLSFTEAVVKDVRFFGIVDSEGKTVEAWVKEPVTVLLDTMTVLGVLQRSPFLDEVAYRIGDGSIDNMSKRWSSKYCQGAINSRRQCSRRKSCDKHKSMEIVWEENARPAESSSDDSLPVTSADTVPGAESPVASSSPTAPEPAQPATTTSDGDVEKPLPLPLTRGTVLF